jgi:hypothetical protein
MWLDTGRQPRPSPLHPCACQHTRVCMRVSPRATRVVPGVQASRLDLVVAGTREALLMIEGFADFLSEEQMLQVGGSP